MRGQHRGGEVRQDRGGGWQGRGEERIGPKCSWQLILRFPSMEVLESVNKVNTYQIMPECNRRQVIMKHVH